MKTLGEIEKEHIMAVLRQCGGRKGEAATLLGIDRKTLFRKLESFAPEQRP
jgi:DNA-binding NtrC family response regulator